MDDFMAQWEYLPPLNSINNRPEPKLRITKPAVVETKREGRKTQGRWPLANAPSPRPRCTLKFAEFTRTNAKLITRSWAADLVALSSVLFLCIFEDAAPGNVCLPR